MLSTGNNCMELCEGENRYLHHNCSIRSRKTSTTFWIILAILGFIILLQTASCAEGETYLRKSTKTVVSRPAMRISRMRQSGRRRYYLPRRPATRIPVKPGYRRIVSRKPEIIRPWPKPYAVRITTKQTPKNTTTLSTPTTVSTTQTSTPKQNSTTTTTIEPTTTTKVPETTSPKAPVTTSTKAPVTTTTVSTTKEVVTKAKMVRLRTRPTTKPTPRTVTRPSSTSNFFRKSTRLRNMSIMHALRRMNKESDYNDLLRKLDYFMSYYPTVREAASRFSKTLTIHEQTSREERKRIWKNVFGVKMELRKLNTKCSGMQRNVSEAMSRSSRQSRELDSYQKSAKKKIDQIEIHQGSQDKQYFEVYQLATNNSRDVERVSADMTSLVGVIGGLFENIEKTNMQEKKTLEILDEHARGNMNDMTNQILVQQNTLASLGNQVRTEMDELHEEKLSMARNLEQHQRRMTETVNAHMSEHAGQITKIERSLNRQSENIKYITSVVEEHDDKLDKSVTDRNTFSNQIINANDELKKMKANISQFMNEHRRKELVLNPTRQAVYRLENDTRQLLKSLNSQHQVLSDTIERMNLTNEEVRSVSHKLDAYRVKQDTETEQLRDELDEILAVQNIHRNNITALLSRNIQTRAGTLSSQYPSDEPAPESTSVTPQELRSLLSEIGVEDKMRRLTRLVGHQQQRMSNVTRAVLRIAEDNEAITMTTSHYFTLINTQAKLIKDQNETIGKLAEIASNQGDTIKSLSIELNSGQETVMKLTNILGNIAEQFKSPMGSQRDCHDVWLNGNRKSGVYNIIGDLSLRPIYCNLTEYGGWTIIQRRNDGSQNFDRDMDEYKRGFGDVYGEYWLGMDTIMTLTQNVRTTVGLEITVEDWEGNSRTAAYSQFYLYGDSYQLLVANYIGDAGDSLAPSNGKPFTAKQRGKNTPCASEKRAGWWFSTPEMGCGESNLNGVYRKDQTQDAGIPSNIYWKDWLGMGYPLKKVRMQIIPSDILNKLYKDIKNAGVRDSKGINGQAAKIPNNKLNKHAVASGRYDPISNNFNNAYEKQPSYEDDLREAGIMGHGPQDYNNFDYNIGLLLNDG